MIRHALLAIATLVSSIPLAEISATNAAYVHILKRETPDTRFHLAELEAFSDGAAPDNAGGASFGGMTTSTNDISAAGTYGNGNSYPTLGTTSALEHGGANRLPNNNLESGGAVWSTANNQASNAQYTLDLGGTHDVTTVRMWPRADGCCSNRWRNLEIQLLDAARNPIPGTLKLHTADTGNVPLEFTFPDASSIDSFTASPETVASDTPVTLSWKIDAAATAASIDQDVGNVLPRTSDGTGSITLDPGPAATTTYQLSVTAGGEVSTAQVTVTVDNRPIITSFDSTQTTVSPGTDVTLSWAVGNFDTLTLNGSNVEDGQSSVVVTPLATTTYTLVASNVFGSTNAELTITALDVPDLIGVNGRFVEVVKNDANDTRLHISEIEVFQFGTSPDDADPDGTSSNDIVQNGNPSTQTPPTTTTLEHGNPGSVFDGDIESSAEVWTTAAGLGTEPRYMLDLGSTNTLNTVRIFGRGDACCPEHLQNITVNVYADNGAGLPGELLNSADFPGVAPPGSSGFIELSLAIPDPGIRSFTVDKTFIPQGETITLFWEVNSASTAVSISDVGDVTARTDGEGAGSITLETGPSINTTYTLTAVRPSGTSVAEVAVEVTDQPLIYSFDASSGIVAPGTAVELSWSVANVTSLQLDGDDVSGATGAPVAPQVTTSYTLTASNPDGSTSRSIRVRVVIPGEPAISEFLADNRGGLLDEDGEASDWIELCNPTGEPASLDGYYLTDDRNVLTKWRLPAVTLPAWGYLVVFASGNDRAVVGSELHTNFSLDRDGEYLALVKPDGNTVVTEFSPFPGQREDVSFGLDAAALQEGYFLSPTPGAANSGSFTDFVADTTFSHDRGFYEQPIAVAITSATPGAEIRYTLNGTKPTEVNGLVYTEPVAIARTTVLRAAAFKPGFVPTNVDTHTYIFATDIIAHPNMRTSVTQDPVYGPQMADSLKAVPSVSLVFQGDIERAEKEASVEFINFEAGDTQLDAGMERFGNYVTNFAKRSMRLNFRSAYGPAKLRFPVFDGHEYPIPPAGQFDSVDLRSGNHDMQARGAYMSNRFTDDTMMAMGQISPHGRFVHVYINGLYWGQYHLRERWNGAMLSEYFGGAKADYEAINANNSGSEFQTGSVYDGTGQYWNEARALVAGPQPFANARSHIDVANVFDFMLLWLSGNSESEFRSAGSVPRGVPFKFFMKDADGFLRSQNRSVTHNGPLNIMTELRTEGAPDYKILLADRIHKHYFNDGAFTPTKNIARLQTRVDEVQLSFLSEAARWNFRTPSSWQSYQNNLVNNHFPGLTNTMVGRFRSAGMYPSTDAPSFSQHGGVVPAGFQLNITAPAGTIYYTLDGSDPRVPQEPVEVDPPLTIVPETAAKKAFVPATASDGFADGGGVSWNAVGYDDATWIAGNGGVGYDTGSGYQSLIDIDVEAQMDDLRTSCLVRVPFTLAAGSLAGKTGATLRVRYDDGYVAYLNGSEIARRNAPAGTPDGNSAASGSHPDTQARVLEPVDISAHFGLLADGGDNVLAIHAMNVSTGSSDFLISADLQVTAQPSGGGAGGAISPTAIEYDAAVPIDATTTVRARVLDNGGWSALNETTFVQDFSSLVVSEFMYNPPPPTPAEVGAGHDDSEDFEFLELLNAGAGPLDLTGVQFVDGIAFDFTGTDISSLPAGGRVLIVEDREAFEFRYGAGHPVAGQYTGKLKDEGEAVELVDPLGDTVRAFTYDNVAPWPVEAAGAGSSLVLANPESIPDHSLATSWQAGAAAGGTPGEPDAPAQDYASWAALNGAGDPDDDDDGDSLSNVLEWLLHGDPGESSTAPLPRAAVQSLVVGGTGADYLTISFSYNLSATDIIPGAEISSDLLSWQAGAGFTELYRTVYHGDGTATATFRSANPVDPELRQFIRAQFQTSP